MASSNTLMYIRNDAGVKTIEDVRGATAPPKCGATGFTSAAYYMPFLDETYNFVRNYTERTPRVDPRVVPLLLAFDSVKGVDSDLLVAKMIDNSLVDQLLEEKFIQKQFGKEFR
jgi:hypothetical protein